MKFLMIVALAAALPLQATTASAADAPSSAVPAQKIDSGLGELPHYRLWTDPTGKNPMGKPQASKPAKSAKASAQGEPKQVAPTSDRVASLK